MNEPNIEGTAHTAENEKVQFPIRSALIPNYFQNFHCLAQDCRDSCCINWAITFDKKDYLRLRRLDAPDELKERLQTYVVRNKKGNHDGSMYAKFDLESNNGRCPFLDEAGLCSIQKACGHEALPEVCTSYPRRVFYTLAKEHTLSPSCEGVLEQLWNLPDGIDFVEEPLPKADWWDVKISTKDNLLLFFAPIRALCIDILQNRSMPLSHRMLYLGIVLQRLQNEDWNRLNVDEWVDQQLDLLESAQITSDIPSNLDMFLVHNLKVLSRTDKGQVWIQEVLNALEGSYERKVSLTPTEKSSTFTPGSMTIDYKYSRDAYSAALSQFQSAFADREYFYENLMVASTLLMNFPILNSPDALWRSYINLCNLYSIFRFVSVLGCKEEATKERLFHYIVMTSRSTLHNGVGFGQLQEELFSHSSSSLAHMAILLCS